MSRADPVEIDFLGLEKSVPRAGTSSIRGIQDAVSKLDPQLLRTFLAFGAAAAVDESYCKRFPAPPMPPAMVPPSRSAAGSPQGAAAPLTIFYNGTVTVFDLPRQKAEAIIRWAETCNAGLQPLTKERVPESLPGVGGQQQQQRPGALVDKLGGSEDIPLARRKSLQRFLEKRKERLTAALPCPGSTSSSSCDWAAYSGEDECGKSQKRQKKASSLE